MKLYVGSLSYNTTEDELKELFSQVGNVVSATILMDKMTGRSRGFGFVEYASDEEGRAAVEKFNGFDFGGRKLVVNEARPMTERKPGGGGFGGRRNFGGGGRGGFGGGRDSY